MERRTRRRVIRRPGLVAAVVLAALAAAPPAFGHAVLVTTEPGNDSVVETTPERVSLRFNERIETAFGGIRIFDSNAKRVDSGRVERPTPESVAVTLDRRLPRGTYTVTWRVVSADSHPVSGAFVFHVEAPGTRPGGIAAQVLDSEAPRSITALFTAVRFLDFALLLLAAGGAATLALVLFDAAAPVRSRLAGALALAAGGLALAALAGIVLQGAAAGGFGLGEALRWEVVSAVLDTRFGRVWLGQAAGATVLAALALALRRRQPPLAVEGALVLAAGLVLTPALAGHASVSGPVAFVVDVAHVQAGAAWAGGLAFLVLGLAWAGGERWPLAARAVPRFSRLALLAVAVLLVAGVVNGYLQVRAWRGLWETTYGLLLLGKAGLVLPLLALGAYNNRRAVPRLRAGLASVVERRRFLRTAGAELGLMVAVVAVTAVLVTEPPARAEVAPEGPYATTTPLGPLELNLVVDPGDAGRNEIHLYLTDESGQLADVAEANVSASLPESGIGPLRLRGFRAGPGHYIATGSLAIAGNWQLVVEARRGEFESLRKTVSVPIRKEP
jgi:copper transport protein